MNSLLQENKKLVFDFDGTLVDSMKQWAGQWIEILEKNNIQYPKDIIKIITPLGNKGTAEYIVKDLGVPMTVDEVLQKALDGFLYEYTNNIPLKENVKETLKILKKQGYSLNVLTASPHQTLDPCLKNNGVFNLFDNVWSCEDFSTTKADVNIYSMVAEKLNCKITECVFLDDNLGSLSTGKKAGMKVIGVYDESSNDFVEEIKKLCDDFIYNMIEILD